MAGRLARTYEFVPKGNEFEEVTVSKFAEFPSLSNSHKLGPQRSEILAFGSLIIAIKLSSLTLKLNDT